MVRDLPPHLPLFNIPKIEVPEELTPVANPVYEDEVPDKLYLSLCQTENLPGLFALHHVSQAAAKDQIIKAQELAYAYLHRAKLRQTVELSRTILKKPKIFEVISLLENLFKEFRILHDYEEIKAFSPKPEVLASIGKKLSNLREDTRDYLVGNGMAVSTT
jgi:hypothetical protein